MPYKDKELEKENKKKYYQEHKEEFKMWGIKYRELHKNELNWYNRNYKESHKETIHQQSLKYNISHQEQRKKYREEHKNHISEYNIKYHEMHKNKRIPQMKKWRREHKDVHKNAVEKWQASHYDKVLLYAKKTKCTRKRGLGFNPLNNSFDGSEAHHVDRTAVVFIPDELHKSISHRQNNEESMKMINLRAWDYLESSVL